MGVEMHVKVMADLPVRQHIRHALKNNSIALAKWLLITVAVGLLMGGIR